MLFWSGWSGLRRPLWWLLLLLLLLLEGLVVWLLVPVPVMGGTGFEMPIGFWKDSKKHALFIAGEQEARH